jgi:hypothetical protein
VSRRLGFALSTALLATVVVTAPAQAATTVTELRGLSDSNWATSINDSGVAVGGSSGDGRPDRAVKWDAAGVPKELVGPTGASTTVRAINSRGVAAGTTTIPGTGTRAIRFNADGTRLVLGTAWGYPTAVGRDVDDSGVVYGLVSNADGGQLPVKWGVNGLLTTLRMPAGTTWAFLTGASSNGYAAGYVSGPGIPFLAVRWNPDGTVTSLARLADGEATSAQAVNSNGEVVGNANDGTGGAVGVRWNADGSVTRYGTAAHPKGINDRGVAVGHTYTANGEQPTRWSRDGEALDLGLPDGAKTAVAVDINNEGVIVGSAGGGFAIATALKWTVG